MARTRVSLHQKITLLPRMQEPLDPRVNKAMVFSRKMKPIKLPPMASLSSIGRNNQSQPRSLPWRVTHQALCLLTKTCQNNHQTAKNWLPKDQIFSINRRARRMKMKFPLNHRHPTWTKLLKSQRAQLTQPRRRGQRKEVRQLQEVCLSQFIQEILYLTECLYHKLQLHSNQHHNLWL